MIANPSKGLLKPRWTLTRPTSGQVLRALLAFAVTIYVMLIGVSFALLPPWMPFLLAAPAFFPMFVNRTFKGNVSRKWWIIGFLAFLVASLLWPKLLAIQLAGPDIRPQRLIVVMLLLMAMYSALSVHVRAHVMEVFSQYKLWSLLLGCLLLHRFFSSVLSDYAFEALYRYVNELVTVGLMATLALFVAKDMQFIERYLKVVLVVTIALAALAVLEVLLGRNLFANILLPGMQVDSEARDVIIAEKLRGGRYRAQATFTNPLQLTEYALYSLPLALPLIFSESRIWRAAGILGMVAALGALMLSGSRAGVGMVFISLVLIVIAIQVSLFAGKRTSWVVWAGLLVLMVGAMVALYGAYDMGYLDALIGGRTLEERQSSEARLTMLKMAWPKILDHPFLGHGVGLAAAILGFKGKSGITIDSYWISYSLDSGLLGLMLFLALAFVSVTAGLIQAKRASRLGALCIYSLIVSVVTVLAFKTILSLSDLDYLLFTNMSLLAVSKQWTNTEKA